MKKVSIILIAGAMALAISPALTAQQYYFEAIGTEGNGHEIQVDALLNLAPTATPGVYSIASVGTTWGGVEDPSGQVWQITGTSGYIGYDLCCMDNLISIPASFSGTTLSGDALSYIDDNALGFTTNDPSIGNPNYGVYVGPDASNSAPYIGNYNFADNGVNGSNTWLPGDATYGLANVTILVSSVPESDSLAMLALCGLGLAGVLLFRAKQSGLSIKR